MNVAQLRRLAWSAGAVLATLYVISSVAFMYYYKAAMLARFRLFSNYSTDLEDPAFWNVTIDTSANGLSKQQADRLRLLREGCQRLSESVWSPETIKKSVSSPGYSLLVDDRLKVIYCRVAKVASTTWTRVLLVADGKAETKYPNKLSQDETYGYLRRGFGLRKLSHYTPSQIAYRLRHYFKFMFVRHPIDRMLSAFKDRLKSDHRIPRHLYSRRIKKYRRPTEKYKDKTVHMPEFIRYMIDPETRKQGFNSHWRPQYSVCHPCRIPYDFIGHYETLSADAATVLARLRRTAVRQVVFPASDPDNVKHRRNLTQRLDYAFQGISKADLNQLRTVVYGKDFQLFGYN